MSNEKFGIDLGRYQTQFNDKLDDVMATFETEVVHNLADSILRIESPFYWNDEGEVDETMYDDWAEAHFDVVHQLGPNIFGEKLYKRFAEIRGHSNE